MPVMTCPNCGTRLAVDSSAAMAFTCPQCLQRVEVRSAGSAGLAPLPVIPVEQQVGRDHFGSMVALLLFAILLMVGIYTATNWSHTFKGGQILLLIGVGVVLLVGISVALAWQPARGTDQAQAAYEPNVPLESEVLDYRRPMKQQRRGRGSMVVALISTFIAGMLACFGLLLLLLLGICGGLFK